MISENLLKHAASVVLGLNGALVELTETLTGFTSAFQNTKIITLTGLISRVSASFSMPQS